MIQMIRLALVFALISSSLQAAVWTYRLPGFGYATGKYCGESIKKVADSFAKATGVEVLGAGCTKAQYGMSEEGEISYTSADQVVITSSDVYVAWGSEGPYSSYESCLNGLASEHKLYVKNVGREPFVQYCYRSNLFGRMAFKGRMDSIGSSNRNKYSTFGNVIGSLQSLNIILNEVRSLASSFGNDVSELYLEPDTYGSRLTLDYYGEGQFYLQIKARAFYATSSECQSQRTSIAARWPNQKIASTFGCASLPGSPVQLLQFWLTPELLSETDITSSRIPTKYESLKACEADRLRVEQAVSKTTQFLATICSDSDAPNSTNMLVLSVRK